MISVLVFPVLVQTGCNKQVEPIIYEAPNGFLLGPDDELEVTVWKNQDLSRTIRVRPDGLISMPIIGDVEAAGLTADALAQRIAERFKRYLPASPSVSVSVKEINSYSVYVMGEVAKPGKFQLKEYVTVLQAISMAGGFTEYAKKNSIQLVRSLKEDHKRKEIHIGLRYDDLVSGTGQGNIVLHSGDTLVVP